MPKPRACFASASDGKVMRSRSRWGPVLLFTVLLCGLGVYARRAFQVTNDITSFVPTARDGAVFSVARALADSDLARSMILTVEGPTTGEAVAAARELGAALVGDPGVAWVRGGVDSALMDAAYQAYFPRRFSFWTDRPELAPSRLSDDALHEAARALRRQLALPLGPLVSKVAAADPLLMFPEYLARLRASRDDSLHLEDGQFVSADGRHAVLFLGTRAAALDGAKQADLLRAIDRSYEPINRAHGGVLHLESSGINRFAVYAQTCIAADIQRVSLASTAGIVILFLLLFRSLRYVALGMVPLAAGGICAIAVTLRFFGSLHGLTLAFGSSLIGVAIDYSALYFTRHTISPDPDGPEGSMLRIWPGLLLGALTTVAGLAGLAWTSVPGLREIAVFSTAGVLTALLVTRWVLPPFVPWHPRASRLLLWLAALAERGLARMTRARRGLFVVPVAGAVICAVGLPRVRWQDDVSALNTVSPSMLAEDERVRERVGGSDPGHFVITLGDSDEEALETNDEVARRLEGLEKEGTLDGFQSLHTVLWSARAQEASHQALVADATLPDRLARAFQAEGFVPDAFRAFASDLAAPRPPPLTLDLLAGSPLVDLVRPFRLAVGGRVAAVTVLRGVHDDAKLVSRLADLRGAHYLDQRAFFGDAYRSFRAATLKMIGAGLVVVLLIVHARYRRVTLTLAAFLPCVIAAATTVSLLALRGSPLNLLHLVGLLLVFSMGADYGIFVVESRDRPWELGATLVSLVVAMLSTVLSFGLLGMSENPALRALGVTAALGTFLSVVFAPAALVLLRPTGDRS
jgi:predicted exporter